LKFTLVQARKNLLILLAGIALVLAAEAMGFFAGMDNHFYDLFLRLRGPVEPDSRILVAAIDEDTLDRLGRWPLRRGHYARLLDRLGSAGVVAMDILMAEPSEDDAILAGAIGRHGRVVLPAYIVNPARIADPVPSLFPARVGHVHLEPDVDGIVRKVCHTLRIQGRDLPSFASAIWGCLTGKALPGEGPPRTGGDPAAQEGIVQGDVRRIDYYGPPGTFPRFSMADIVEGRYPDDFFREKIVFVGVTAAGLETSVLSPFTEHRNHMPGVEAHAHILGNLMDGRSIAGVPAPVRWGAAVAFSFLLLPPFLRMGGRRGALLWAAGIAAMTAASFVLLVLPGLWFSPVLPSFLVSFLFLAAYVFRLENVGLQLREATQAWEESFHTINDAIVLTDGDGKTVRMNTAAKMLLTPDVLESLSRKRAASEEAPAAMCAIGKDGPDPSETGNDVEEIFDPRTAGHLEARTLPRRDRTGRLIGFVHVVRDVTARKKAEEEKEKLRVQLLQSEKMQCIGRLAGGVAHDFNNILTAILGYSELALMNVPEGGSLRKSIQIIHESGMKASALTRQLLAFSRKQVMELKVVNLEDVVKNMSKILMRVIGEDVMLKLNMEKPVRNILADPVHVEQVLMNLAVNARDAMPRGGSMTIETADVELDASYAARHEGLVPGPYVMLAVSDTGAGMIPEVRARIFEPFFTTKKAGEGTGLGLSTVYGIVSQMSGHIYVYSEEGKGSVFKVYFPVCDGDAADRAGEEAPAAPRGTETVLVAEDDPFIRQLIVDVLGPLGYRVIPAGSGLEALKIAERSERRIDALLTDIVMPGMSGKELAQKFQEVRPRTRVLFMSGYNEEVILKHGVEQEGVSFIQKPLVPNKLAAKLRKVLDGR